MEGLMLEDLCINMVVKYTYKLKSLLHDKELGPTGFCVLVMTDTYFFEIDVPAEIFDPELMAYIKFRLNLSQMMDIHKLPTKLQEELKIPLAFFIECWLLENEDGDSSERKDTDA